jgi:hypothetical protein
VAAASTWADGWLAAISAAAATAPTTNSAIARGPGQGAVPEPAARVAIFGRLARRWGVAFFGRSAIFLSESRCSLRSPESRYRTDGVGFFAFFARTGSLLVELSG